MLLTVMMFIGLLGAGYFVFGIFSALGTMALSLLVLFVGVPIAYVHGKIVAARTPKYKLSEYGIPYLDD